MKRVGVTGAAGFIGSHLCDRLVSEGLEVVGVDDLSRGTLSNLENCIESPLFTFEQFDCTQRRPLRSAFDGCDTIVHLAAQKIPRYEGALKCLESNVAGVKAAAMVALAIDADLPGRVDVGRLRKRHAAVRRGRCSGARPADEPSLGLCGLEAVRRARLPRPRGRARPARHDHALLRLLRPAQSSELVGQARRRRSSRRCSTAAPSTSTATASRRGRSRSSRTRSTASCAPCARRKRAVRS